MLAYQQVKDPHLKARKLSYTILKTILSELHPFLQPVLNKSQFGSEFPYARNLDHGRRDNTLRTLQITIQLRHLCRCKV
jgi:hypothetical protein